MANTTATKLQADAIKHQMQLIRNELPYDVDVARARVRQLTDWKYHVRKRPWPLIAAGAVLGYLLVPAKKKKHVVIKYPDGSKEAVRSSFIHHSSDPTKTLPKKSLLGGMAGAAMTMLLRAGTTFAMKHASDLLSATALRRAAANQRPSGRKDRPTKQMSQQPEYN